MQVHQGFKAGFARAVAALTIVVAGVFFVSPSFDPDTDGDGVADAHEISVGTDPATPNADIRLTARTTSQR